MVCALCGQQWPHKTATVIYWNLAASSCLDDTETLNSTSVTKDKPISRHSAWLSVDKSTQLTNQQSDCIIARHSEKCIPWLEVEYKAIYLKKIEIWLSFTGHIILRVASGTAYKNLVMT